MYTFKQLPGSRQLATRCSPGDTEAVCDGSVVERICLLLTLKVNRRKRKLTVMFHGLTQEIISSASGSLPLPDKPPICFPPSPPTPLPPFSLPLFFF